MGIVHINHPTDDTRTQRCCNNNLKTFYSIRQGTLRNDSKRGATSRNFLYTTHHSSQSLNPNNRAFNGRQSSNLVSNDDLPLDIGTIAAAGEVCIDKVVTVEEVEYDNVIECKHSYSQRCHETYKTDYSPQQEEECEENFKKNCFIEYKKRASKETVQICNTPLVKNCDIQGPLECKTEFQTQCTTRYHEHEVIDDIPDCKDENEVKCEDVTQGYTTEQKCSKWPVKKCKLSSQTVKKYSPETHCTKVPFELCGPAACPTEPGPDVCISKEETFVVDQPQEECNLEPQKSCKLVTKLIPLLKAVENFPIIKKWCYTPKLETSSDIKPGSSNPRGVTVNPPTEAPPTCSTFCRQRRRDGVCHPECNTPLCDFDGENGVCNPECNTPNCNNDGGDCITTTTRTTTTRATTTRTTTTRTTTTRTTTTTTPNIGYLPPYSG
ncbi:NOTCH4 [Lepeophtheirus salmonis]|uniref:NOTCH4 n=1 Tax=Lepeophtheirus salmonis TaxID=72036 RepID=A0A7R8CBT4_LEPSM|nr:NOTCH4 [Lepeophtheirus salmonis]CAF2762354.1 NOTCH4 [Lepeophtheirus salmonis]